MMVEQVRRSLRTRSVALLSLCSIAGSIMLPFDPSYAADPTAAKVIAIDPARRAAAEALAQSIDLKGQLRAANEMSAGQLETTMLRQIIENDPKARSTREKNPERFERVMAGLQSFIGQEVRKTNAELEPTVYSETIDIYARTFTEGELREIQAFYGSPLGKKLLEKQPELMRECIAMSQRLLVQKMPALFQRMKEHIQTNDLSFAEDGTD